MQGIFNHIIYRKGNVARNTGGYHIPITIGGCCVTHSPVKPTVEHYPAPHKSHTHKCAKCAIYLVISCSEECIIVPNILTKITTYNNCGWTVIDENITRKSICPIVYCTYFYGDTCQLWNPAFILIFVPAVGGGNSLRHWRHQFHTLELQYTI